MALPEHPTPPGTRHYSWFSSAAPESLQAGIGDLVNLTVTDRGFDLAVRYMADNRRYTDHWGFGIEEHLSYDTSREIGGIIPGLGNGELWMQRETSLGYFHNRFARPTHLPGILRELDSTAGSIDPRLKEQLTAYDAACKRREVSRMLFQRSMLMRPAGRKRAAL